MAIFIQNATPGNYKIIQTNLTQLINYIIKYCTLIIYTTQFS